MKKDFKIRGTIGLPGQKDKLSFSSLVYQIESGTKKGYSKVEICEEVVRAVSPDLQLRSFLEGKADLTLQNLRRILRAHFREQDHTTLFNALCNSSQQSIESPLDFVIRLMNLRQKILFVLKEVDDRFEYSELLVQNQFLHSVVTGLSNDSIKNEIKPLLPKRSLSDEELLDLLNKAVGDESERQSKIKKQVNFNTVESNLAETEKREKKVKDNPVLNELKELRLQLNEVTTLKSEIEQLKQQVHRRSEGDSRIRFRRNRFACAVCRKNDVARCTHCYSCGGSDHFKIDCKNKSEN